MTKKNKLYAFAGFLFVWILKKMYDRKKTIDLIARTAWGEDGNGGAAGMQAVINVIDNRRKIGGWFGKGWDGVILKPMQFSIWNAATTEQYKNNPEFVRYLAVINAVDEKNVNFATAKKLAAAAYDGNLSDITGGSTHYKLPNAYAAWAVGKTPAARVGSHDFYNNVD